VVQLSAANHARRHKIDLRDSRRVDREDTLDAHAIRDLADGHRLIQARTAARNHDTLEMLDALLIAFDDAHRHVNDVPGPELRNILTNLSKVDGVYDLFHGGKRCSVSGYNGFYFRAGNNRDAPQEVQMQHIMYRNVAQTSRQRSANFSLRPPRRIYPNRLHTISQNQHPKTETHLYFIIGAVSGPISTLSLRQRKKFRHLCPEAFPFHNVSTTLCTPRRFFARKTNLFFINLCSYPSTFH
jgi:hypothetical protein